MIKHNDESSGNRLWVVKSIKRDLLQINFLFLHLMNMSEIRWLNIHESQDRENGSFWDKFTD